MQEETRRAWIEVDLGALKRNAAMLAARAQAPLLPMVKADGYGLGAVPVARALDSTGPWGFGVATVAEGAELRQAGIDRRILVVSPLLPWDFDDARRWRLIPTLGPPAAIAAWIASGGGPWHLSIDTGMNRAGVRWDCIADVVDLVRSHPPDGAFTHLHSPEANDQTMARQQERFRQAVAVLPARPPILHAEGSAAVERQSPSPWDLARPGVFLYGVGGGPGSPLRPEGVAHFRARVLEVHDVPNGETVSYGGTWRSQGDRRVATIGVGYADGYRRAFSNGGPVLIHGRLATVAGLVNMDMTMIDVTGVPCEVGDVVTLLGRDGEVALDINDVARDARLSPYELLVGLSMRAPRVYSE
jgi:alanine racemase